MDLLRNAANDVNAIQPLNVVCTSLEKENLSLKAVMYAVGY